MNVDARPNLFLIGAPKCGTSAFIDQLRQHPAVYVPREKELLYFDREVFFDDPRDYHHASETDYLGRFDTARSASARYRGDGSVFVMYSRGALERILTMSPDARFILILRDPLSACKSMHVQRMKYIDPTLREVSTDFCTCWDLLSERAAGRAFPPGCRSRIVFRYDLLYSYERYLEMIAEVVPTGRLLVIDYERFRDAPRTVHRSVFRFLDLEPVELPLIRTNPSYTVDPNRLQTILGHVLRATATQRRTLGLTHGRFPWLDRLLEGKRTSVDRGSTRCDERVREFFAPASRAMHEAFSRHGIESFLE